MKALATFNTIALEVQFSGDDNENATVQLQFKKQTDTTWRNGLPYGMWGVWTLATSDPIQTRGFYQSIVDLDPGTSYDVRATFTDPDGIVGSSTVNLTVTTDEDNIPDPLALTPDHYVDPVNGTDDQSHGTSPGIGAWKTLAYAWTNAPSGAIVQLASGYYVSPGKARTLPITILGAVPPIQLSPTVISDETWQQATVANVGEHAVIDSGIYTSPTGSGDVNAGAWRQVTLNDPYTGKTFSNIWKWTAPVAKITQMGYARTRSAQPQRVANWKAYASSFLSTPASFAGQVTLSQMARSGFWVAENSRDIYLRLPRDANPNDYYITLGRGAGLELNGPNQRISQVELRAFNADVQVESGASSTTIDHDDLEMAYHQVFSYGSQPASYGNGLVIQDNLMADSNMWLGQRATVANTTEGIGIPWAFIKGKFIDQSGKEAGVQHVGQNNETNGVYLAGGAWRTVIRNNTMDGPFNGVTSYNAGFDRYAGWLTDIHDNLIRHIGDDALEPEDGLISWQMWHNRMEYTRTTLSVAPVAYGPVVYWRNQGWETGIFGIPPNLTANPWDGNGQFIKWGGGPKPPSIIYYVANTMWSDVTCPNPSRDNACATDGGGNYAGGGGTPEAFYFRDNLWRTERYALQVPKSAVIGDGNLLDEDFDQAATTDPQRGVDYGRSNARTIARYRELNNQGEHSQPLGDFHDVTAVDVALRDPLHGDLRAVAGSGVISKGVAVDNVLDRPGIDFAGSTPNIGADQATQ